MKVHNLVVTGSLSSGGENITSISSSVSTTVTELSSSLTSSIGSLSSSMVTMVNDMSSSFDTTIDTLATTGSNLFVGTQTISGSLVPAVDSEYDLGSPTNNFRHLYLSSASLYIDGTKVLGSTSQELQITTDSGQSFKILEAGSDTITLQSGDGNITLASSGGGDVIMDPTNGIIALKGTTTLYAGNRILSSDGNAIQFGNSVTMTGSLVVTGFIETQELRTTYISSSILFRSGSTKFGDELGDTHSFTGSLTVSGSINVPGSGLVSGSSQITYSGLSGVPSGIISGSSQLPSGVVSGSAQVDIMSTTNIARLATTGSNIFSSNQVVTGSISSTGNISAGTTFNWNGGIGALSYGSGIVTLETNTANAIQLKTNGTTAITISTGQTVTLSDNLVFSKGVDPKISSGTGIGLNIDGEALYLNRYSQSNIVMVQNGGNVGIGGSPSGTYGTLSVFGGISIKDNNNAKLEIGRYSSGVSNSYIKLGANSNSLRFTNNTDVADILELTNSGHLGLGTTPSPWASPFNVIQGGSYGQSIGFQTNGPDIKLGTNNYYNGSGYVYVTSSNGAAQLNVGGNSGFQFNTAPSGTSGNTITFTTAMSITNGGNVIIGSGTTATSLDISSRTDAITLPRGTTAQRPGTSVAGMGRFNTTTTRTEFFNGNVWVNVGGNADGSTSSSAAASAKAIKQVVGNPTSGVYWLQVPNVNGGNPFQCYCDFTMDGGVGYAIIFNQYFEGAETGPSHASFGATTISTAGFDTEYQINPTAMISNYGITKLAVFARTGGTAVGGITGASYFNWVAFTGPTTTQYNLIFTNGYNDTQFTGTFNSSDGNTGTAYFPNSHGNTGGVTQITNGTTVNDNILYEYKQGAGTDPNHFWMVGNGRTGDVYWVVNNRYGSGTGNVMYNRWGGVALY